MSVEARHLQDSKHQHSSSNSLFAGDQLSEGKVHRDERVFRELLAVLAVKHFFPERELAIRMRNTFVAVVRVREGRFEESALPSADRLDINALWHMSRADADSPPIPGVKVRR